MGLLAEVKALVSTGAPTTFTEMSLRGSGRLPARFGSRKVVVIEAHHPAGKEVFTASKGRNGHLYFRDGRQHMSTIRDRTPMARDKVHYNPKTEMLRDSSTGIASRLGIPSKALFDTPRPRVSDANFLRGLRSHVDLVQRTNVAAVDLHKVSGWTPELTKVFQRQSGQLDGLKVYGRQVKFKAGEAMKLADKRPADLSREAVRLRGRWKDQIKDLKAQGANVEILARDAFRLNETAMQLSLKASEAATQLTVARGELAAAKSLYAAELISKETLKEAERAAKIATQEAERAARIAAKAAERSVQATVLAAEAGLQASVVAAEATARGVAYAAAATASAALAGLDN